MTVIRPDGAGIQAAWTPDAGSNYARVNEATADDDTSYVSTSTRYADDHYTFGNITLSAGAVISSVVVNARVRKVAAGSAQSIYLMLYDPNNTTYYYGSSVVPLTDDTAYHDYSRTYTTNPRTGAAWTEAEVNGEQFGYQKGDAVASAIRVTQIWVTVNINTTVTPATLATTTTKFAPTSKLNIIPKPTTAALLAATYAPTVVLPRRVTPSTLAVLTAKFAPTINIGVNVTPTTKSLVLASFAPLVLATAHKLVTPTTLAIYLGDPTETYGGGDGGYGESGTYGGGLPPTVLIGNYVRPTSLPLVTSPFAPAPRIGGFVRPEPATLVLVTFAPVILIPNIGLPRLQLGAGRFYGPQVSSSVRVTINKTGSARFHGPQRGSGR